MSKLQYNLTSFRFPALVFLVMMAWSVVLAGALSSHTLPAERFNDWATLCNENTDTLIRQLWRQPFPYPVRGASGYTVVSYQVENAATPEEAAKRAQEMLLKKRFSDYTIKGYEIATTPWKLQDGSGIIFTVRGTDYASDSTHYNQAVIYTFTLTRKNWLIWLETRQVCSADDSSVIERTLQRANILGLTEELMKSILKLWPVAAADSNNQPEDNRTPMQGNPPNPSNGVVIDQKPTGNVEVVIDPPPAAAPNSPPDTSPKVTDDNRWFTTDHHLSLALPSDWKTVGKNPVIFAGPDDVTIRFYTAEKYSDQKDLAAAIDDFITSQQAVSCKRFTHTAFEIDGAIGVLARYTNYLRHTVQTYYFGKSGRLWRLDVEIPGENTPLPDAVKNLVQSIKVD